MWLHGLRDTSPCSCTNVCPTLRLGWLRCQCFPQATTKFDLLGGGGRVNFPKLYMFWVLNCPRWVSHRFPNIDRFIAPCVLVGVSRWLDCSQTQLHRQRKGQERNNDVPPVLVLFCRLGRSPCCFFAKKWKALLRVVCNGGKILCSTWTKHSQRPKTQRNQSTMINTKQSAWLSCEALALKKTQMNENEVLKMRDEWRLSGKRYFQEQTWKETRERGNWHTRHETPKTSYANILSLNFKRK